MIELATELQGARGEPVAWLETPTAVRPGISCFTRTVRVPEPEVASGVALPVPQDLVLVFWGGLCHNPSNEPSSVYSRGKSGEPCTVL